MMDLLSQIFGKDPEMKSKDTAKERLRLVLVHDRTSISPQLLETLREELIAGISKYLEIDEGGLEVNLDRNERAVALVASIPIRKMKRPFDVAVER
ncbi:MAG: cell division topological specificity factor MinE [Firmicutes bacterium]|nr:cell division topological specificity factor MinE [Bacillota bacterium]